ncbi:MAG: hypothetical protein ACKVP5_08515 [Aestuariivirga sp.]
MKAKSALLAFASQLLVKLAFTTANGAQSVPGAAKEAVAYLLFGNEPDGSRPVTAGWLSEDV